MINERLYNEIPNVVDGYLEITPGLGAHPDDPVVIVTGTDARAWEIARRIERMLFGELDDAQRCETIARGPNAGKRCTRSRGHKGLHWVRVATNEVPPTDGPCPRKWEHRYPGAAYDPGAPPSAHGNAPRPKCTCNFRYEKSDPSWHAAGCPSKKL